jgi:hypothetical protein
MVSLAKNYPFNAIDKNELNDFIERAETEYISWYENPLDLKINHIEAFESKCIVCFFGKTIKAYRAVYKKMKDEQLAESIIYTRSLAIYFDIKKNELFDFGWCNKFLDKNEMNILVNRTD